MKATRGELPVQDLMPLFGSNTKHTNRQPKQVPFKFLGGIFCLVLIITLGRQPSYRDLKKLYNGSSGVYKGKTWISKQTVSKIVAAETKFARCDIHTVRLEDGTLVNDWLFLEERDAINVIVLNTDNKFIMFQQSKYAIEGETFSPVGGFVDEGEEPIEAAKREVKEELGVGSRISAAQSSTGTDPDWIPLGSYRTAANRGAGFSHFFLLKQAVPLLPNGGTSQFKGSGDAESQKILFLTKDQVLHALSKAQMQEVKWTAALALALLHLDQKIPAVTNTPIS